MKGLFALVAAFAAQPALACERHDKDDAAAARSRADRPAVTFAAAKPLAPAEGEIWIDAKNGAQYRYGDGRWTLRSRPIARAAGEL